MRSQRMLPSDELLLVGSLWTKKMLFHTLGTDELCSIANGKFGLRLNAPDVWVILDLPPDVLEALCFQFA